MDVLQILRTIYDVTIYPAPTVNMGVDATLCEGDSLTLSGTGNGILTWSNGMANNSTFTPPIGLETFTLTSASPDGCETMDSIIVNVLPTYSVNRGPDFVVCENEQIALNASSTELFNWNNGVIDGQLFFPVSGDYVVTTMSGGCPGIDTVNVIVNPAPMISGGQILLFVKERCLL